MTVALAALVLAGAGCSGAGRDKPKAAEPEGRPPGQPRAHLTGPAVWDIATAGPRLVFAAATIGLERSADGGRSWTDMATGSYRQVDVVSERVVFAVGQGKVVRTVNGGQSWHPLPRAPVAAEGIDEIDFWSASSGVVLDPDDEGGSYWVTRDGGQSWQRLRLPG
jgi:hypothetical protein